MFLTVGPRFNRGRAVRLALAAALWVAGPAFLAGGVLAQPVTGAAAPQPAETLVLRVTLNTEGKGDLFVQRTADSDFWVRLDDLKAMGFKDLEGATRPIDGEAHLSLRSVRGLSFRFEEQALALHITAEPRLLPGTTLGLREQRRRGTVTGSSDSAFLNYALTGSQGSFSSARGMSLATEAGIRWGESLFLTDASTVETPTQRRFVRLMSSVIRDDRQNLRRFVFGDVLTPTRDFSNSVNLGGISVSKLYGLDPHFVRFPTQSLTGSVAVPSEVEVYIDGQRVRTERLRPGEFELQDILAYGGARNVQVLLRDAFGRVQQLNYSLYFTEQPLQRGLHEYSYNLGAIRRDFGVRSSHYGPPALTFFHRYGVSNGLTVGWRAEGKRDFLSTGPTVTAVLGPLGVVNWGTTASTFEGRTGHASLASYSFDSHDWALGVFLRHDSRDYASLGDPPLITNRRHEGSVSATYRLRNNASVSLSRNLLSTRPAEPAASTDASPQALSAVSLRNRQVSAVSFSTPLGSSRTQLTATLSRINDGQGPRRTEGFVSLNVLFDRNHSAAASYRADRQSHSESFRFSRSQPVGEGLGYDLTTNRSNLFTDSTQTRANVQYNAPAAVLRAELGSYDDQDRRSHDQRVSVAGSIITAGGHFAASRPVTQSYALVKVGDLQGVGILVDGLPVASTGRSGIAAIPSLNAYYENSVAVAGDALPMNYALPAAVRRVVPSYRSGAFVDFGVTRIQAFSGRLITPVQGARRAIEFAEIHLQVGDERRTLTTARGGEFYLENLPPGTYPATVSSGVVQCRFDLEVPESEEMIVELGELECRQVSAGTTSERRD